MKHSNLALRFEEFEEVNQLRTEARQTAQAAQTAIVAAPDISRDKPRRLSLTTRRIQIRDPGLRQFRVF